MDCWRVVSLFQGNLRYPHPKGYNKVFLHNTLRSDSEEIIFPVKHYESLFYLLSNIPRFFEPFINESFIRIFSKYINIYEGQSKELFNSCRVENSIIVNANLVSYFPALVDIMIFLNYQKQLWTFVIAVLPQWTFPIKIILTLLSRIFYTDIIKQNLVGDFYVRLLISLHFPSDTGYHRFKYPLQKPVEPLYIE